MCSPLAGARSGSVVGLVLSTAYSKIRTPVRRVVASVPRGPEGKGRPAGPRQSMRLQRSRSGYNSFAAAILSGSVQPRKACPPAVYSPGVGLSKRSRRHVEPQAQWTRWRSTCSMPEHRVQSPILVRPHAREVVSLVHVRLAGSACAARLGVTDEHCGRAIRRMENSVHAHRNRRPSRVSGSSASNLVENLLVRQLLQRHSCRRQWHVFFFRHEPGGDQHFLHRRIEQRCHAPQHLRGRGPRDRCPLTHLRWIHTERPSCFLWTFIAAGCDLVSNPSCES